MWVLDLPLVPVAQQRGAREEAHVVPDAHGGAACGGAVWNLRGPGLLQRGEGPQQHHAGHTLTDHMDPRPGPVLWVIVTYSACFVF